MKQYRYLIARRLVQASIILLFFMGSAYGWTILRGNLSFAKLFDAIPLADPFAALQGFSAMADISRDFLIGALLILFFYAVIGGRLFCGWVCPLNIVTDTANWLRKLFALSSGSVLDGHILWLFFCLISSRLRTASAGTSVR
jgi:ferredoxin-type protein NapH